MNKKDQLSPKMLRVLQTIEEQTRLGKGWVTSNYITEVALENRGLIVRRGGTHAWVITDKGREALGIAPVAEQPTPHDIDVRLQLLGTVLEGALDRITALESEVERLKRSHRMLSDEVGERFN